MYRHLNPSRAWKGLAVLLGVVTALAVVSAPAYADPSCPDSDFFALIPAATDFEQSKDKNEDGLVCRSREFVLPPPGYPSTYIVIDDIHVE